MKKDLKFELQWEDIGERLLYATIDDQAWELPELIFNYKKGERMYIFHDGKLAAFYNKTTAIHEAAIGHTFYVSAKNRKKIVQMKQAVRKNVDATQDILEIEKISYETLMRETTLALDLFLHALSTHYLSMPAFFTEFDNDEVLQEISESRLSQTRYAWTKAMSRTKRYLSELGRRKGMSLEEMESHTREELKSGIVERDILAQRQEKFVLLSNNGTQHVILGKDVEKYITTYEEIKNISEARGVTGNKGKVMARCFVVKNEHLDLTALPEGMQDKDVLIVQNAWPEFTKYYKKACAIVTNEGGITSHGVVVARELDIPCIVGTKIATKIFSTGDLVEVDAEKGTVRKL